MKIFFIFFIILILAALTTIAIDTLSIENCVNLGINCDTTMLGENITLEEQKEYVLGILLSKHSLPYHDFVKEWNTNLTFEMPYNITLSNHKTISNAWIDMAVMPSVKDGKVNYIDEKGSILTVYGYDLGMPEDYFNGRNRICGQKGGENEFGDCKTEYKSNRDATTLGVYQNGKLIGTERITNFISEERNNFESALNIKNEISLKHYKWEVDGCCRKCPKGGCCAYAYACKFDSEDTQEDNLVIKKGYDAEMEIPLEEYDPTLVVSPSSLPIIAAKEITVKNLQSYSIKTKNQLLKKNFKSYKVGYTLEPNNLLYVYADEGDKWYIDNTKIISSTPIEDKEIVSFITDKNNLDKCSLSLFTYFNSIIKDCDVKFLKEVDFSIEPDKMVYYRNETIRLKINLKSSEGPVTAVVAIKYGDQTKFVTVSGTGEVELKPIIGETFILASMDNTKEYSAATTSSMITVLDYEKHVSAIWVVFIIVFLYFGFKFMFKLIKGEKIGA